MAFGDLKGTLTGEATSITNPMPCTGSVAVSLNDLIYVVIAEQDSITAGAASDNLGNTYTAVNAGGDSGAIATGKSYYSRVTVAGTLTTINIAATASVHNVVVLAQVITGPFATSPLDGNPADAQDLTTPYTCPSTGTLAQADEVVCCYFVATGTVTLTATSPNTKAVQLNTATILTNAIGYQTVAVTTAVAPEWTDSGSPVTTMLGTASFKKAATATASYPLFRRFKY